MKKDVFGTKGDFTTSPEISQMFGEVRINAASTRSCSLAIMQMLALWSIDCWRKLGSPPRVALVEMGPGRGTVAVH